MRSDTGKRSQFLQELLLFYSGSGRRWAVIGKVLYEIKWEITDFPFSFKKRKAYSLKLVYAVNKHRKNCECCPVSLLIVRRQRLSCIQVLNCQNWNYLCVKYHKDEGGSCISQTNWRGEAYFSLGELCIDTSWIRKRRKKGKELTWLIWQH